jgi:hypothetical protein
MREKPIAPQLPRVLAILMSSALPLSFLRQYPPARVLLSFFTPIISKPSHKCTYLSPDGIRRKWYAYHFPLIDPHLFCIGIPLTFFSVPQFFLFLHRQNNNSPPTCLVLADVSIVAAVRGVFRVVLLTIIIPTHL